MRTVGVRGARTGRRVREAVRGLVLMTAAAFAGCTGSPVAEFEIPEGEPAASTAPPPPALPINPDSGLPVFRDPLPTDSVAVSASRSIASTGVFDPCANAVTLTLITPVDVNPQKIDYVIAEVSAVRNGVRQVLWALSQGGESPARFGTLTATCSNGQTRAKGLVAVPGRDGEYTVEYFPPDLVLERMEITIRVFSTLTGPATPLGAVVLAVQPPQSPLTAVAVAQPNSITLQGSSEATRTATLSAEITGGVPSPTGEVYDVQWVLDATPLDPATQTLEIEDRDNDGVGDTVVSRRTVRATEDLRGTQIYRVTVRDSSGNETSDSAVVTVNDPLAVLVSLSPPAFTGTETGLRATLSATPSGGTGNYKFQWRSIPTIADLFEGGAEAATRQQVSFLTSKVGEKAATFEVTVTDSAGNVKTGSVERGFGGGGAGGGGAGALTVTIGNPPACAVVGETFTLTGSVSGGIAPILLQWSSTCPGAVFGTPNAQNSSWTAPAAPGACTVTLQATDNVGTVKTFTTAPFNVIQPLVAFATATSASADEAAAAHSVNLVLSLPGCATSALPQAVSVTVTDLVTGTATSGVDYTALAVPTVVTFPAGSTNGAVQPLNIPVLPDTSVEGNETIALSLSNPTGGAALGVQTAHTVTVTDDDAATLAFSNANSATAAELGNHSVSVTLSVPGGGTTAVPVTVAVVDATGGSAASGADYAPVVGAVLAFPAGSGNGDTQSFDLGVLADALVEGNETVNLALGAITGPATAGAQTTHQVTITDDDAASIAFTNAASATVSELAGTHPVAATLTVPGGGVTAVPITVNLVDAGGGSATSGADYAGVGAVPLTFPIGSGNGATVNFNLQVLGDLLTEGDETVNLQLAAITGPATLGALTVHTATITDDDAASVSFVAAASATADESAANHAVGVQLNLQPGGSLAIPIGLNVIDAGGGTSTSGADYAPVNVPVNFAAGSVNGATANINVSILADAVAEGNETINLALSGVTPPATSAAPAAHTVTITDDDGATVAFSAPSSATAAESGNQAVAVRLTLGGGGTTAVPINVAILDAGGGSATSGVDYTALAGVVLTFPAGSANGDERILNLAVLGDLLVEGSETVNLALGAIDPPAVAGTQTTHQVTITDDDGASVAFTAPASATATEAAGNHPVSVTLSVPGGGTTAVPITVNLVDAGGGTATSGTDYAAVGTVPLTFPIGSANGATLAFNLQVLGDLLTENNETVNLQLATITVPAVLGGTVTHAVTLTDDDAATVSFIAGASATADESAANHLVGVRLNLAPGGSLAVAVAVNVVDAGGGSATSGVDYGPVNLPVNFPIGSANGSVVNVNVAILADAASEGNETINLSLSGLSGPASLAAPAAHVVTITDDDGATLAFTAASSLTAGESGNHGVNVRLSLAGGGSTAVPITVAVVDAGGGSATSAADYTAVAGAILTFPAGSNDGDLQAFNLNVLADALVEGAETVNLALGAVTGPAAAAGQTTHQVTITDEDSATVAFTTGASATPNEANVNHVVTVRLTIPGGATLAQPVTVNVTASDLTATAGIDYTDPGVVPLTFPIGSANNASLAYPLEILGDALHEGNEAVSLSLTLASGPASLGATVAHTVTITDDDPAPSVTLGASGASILETGETSVTVTATLNVVSGLATTVNLAFSGTAVNVDDYTRTDTQIVIPAGVLDGSITLQAVDDALDEDDNETVIVDISSVINGTESGVQQVTVNVEDDDPLPAVELDASGLLILENGETAVQVRARLVGGAISGRAVTVDLSFGGSATNVTDYTRSSDQIVIAAGVNEASVTITAVDDGDVEAVNQTVEVGIAAITNGLEEGGAGTQQVTIEIESDE